MARRKQSDKPRPDRTTAWIDSSLVRLAKKIASHEGVKLSEVLESALKAPLARRAAKL